jgi:flagellar hook-basal body complex protein FliE
MSIGPIEGLGPLFTPLAVPTATAPTAPTGPTGPGREFGSMVLDGIERLEGLQDTADTLAVRAASGTLPNIHDYPLAATEAEVATKLTVAVRNKAIESFTEIMRMQVG